MSNKTILTALIGGLLLTLTFTLASAQSNQTSAVLTCTPPSSGRVLIAGGFNQFGIATARAEYFDPSTATFKPECGMTSRREGAVSVVFPAGSPMAGKILIMGGESVSDLNTTDIFTPSTGKFWRGPVMPAFAEYTQAVLMNNGKVLIPKGEYDTTTGEYPVKGVMIFNPVTRIFWNQTSKMTVRRAFFAAALISGCGCSADSKVLIAGGFSGKSNIVSKTYPTKTAELYDPATRTFTATTGDMNVARVHATATTLPDGTVLVAGGGTATAEIYDPVSGTFTLTNNDMYFTRSAHTATLLPDDTVLIAGGDFTTFNSAEIYDPATRTFSLTINNMSNLGRYDYTATLISGSGTSLDGQVLLAGGYDDQLSKELNTAEIYNPADQSFTPTGNMVYFHARHTANLIP
jgi:WD40 repeat protein